MKSWKILRSSEDASVNFIAPSAVDDGFLEARFVQRTPDYFIAYLSSHTGCRHACRFCHLTATGQTSMTPASLADFSEQATQALLPAWEQRQEGRLQATRLHFNFMARGEVLSNPTMVNESQAVFDALAEQAQKLDIEETRFLISSIIPADFDGDLSRVLGDERSTLYYSLYSMDPSFRRRWLPRAMDPRRALDKIAQMQVDLGRDVALHWAFIEGENDQEASVDHMMDEIETRGIRAKFNLVRYNPHSARHGQEPGEERLQTLFERINARLNHPRSRIVPRVGRDVQASCGMFVTGI